MKYYKCLTQDEFENLEEGTEVEFLSVKPNKCFNGVITSTWEWETFSFHKRDLALTKPNYFQYGKYRILVAETKYISVMDDMVEEITKVVTDKTLSN